MQLRLRWSCPSWRTVETIHSFFRKVVTERNKKLDDLQKTHTVLEENVFQQSNGSKNGSSGGITKATMVRQPSFCASVPINPPIGILTTRRPYRWMHIRCSFRSTPRYQASQQRLPDMPNTVSRWVLCRELAILNPPCLSFSCRHYGNAVHKQLSSSLLALTLPIASLAARLRCIWQQLCSEQPTRIWLC